MFRTNTFQCIVCIFYTFGKRTIVVYIARHPKHPQESNFIGVMGGKYSTKVKQHTSHTINYTPAVAAFHLYYSPSRPPFGMLWMAMHSRMCVVGFRRLLLFLYIINDQIKCVTSVIYRMVYMADLIAMCVNRNGANDKGRCVWCVSIVIFWTFFTWTIAPLEQSIVNLNGHPFIAMQMNMQCWC